MQKKEREREKKRVCVDEKKGESVWMKKKKRDEKRECGG